MFTVVLEVFLKFEFFEDTVSRVFVGSIAKGKFKFQVKCYDSNVKNRFTKGCKIRIRGSIDTSGSVFFLKVENAADIELIPNEVMSKENLQKAIFVPRKRKLCNDTPKKVIFFIVINV